MARGYRQFAAATRRASSRRMSCPRGRISANIMGSWLDSDACVWAARGDVAAEPFSTAAGKRGSVGEGWPAGERLRAEAGGAKQRGGSGGLGQAGRVLKLVDQRLEQKDHQEVGQQVGSGRAFIEAWRPFQAEQAFQALEGELDAPAQAIKGEHISRGELLWREGGHEDITKS